LIVPDTNLIVYAYNSESPFHEAAAKWWVSCLSGIEPVGLPWVVALGFIRLWTHPRVFANPMPITLAVSHVESWLARRVVKIIHPGPHHADLLFDFLRKEGKGGNITTDAHIAALAVEAHATLHTADTDFIRFTGLKWINPLTRPTSVRETEPRTSPFV